MNDRVTGLVRESLVQGETELDVARHTASWGRRKALRDWL
jgi:hypothetical protein